MFSCKIYIYLIIGAKRFTCNYCNKTFALQSHLKIHERMHTGERPYKCDLCKLAFARQADLKKHKKTHLKLKPFSCTLCEKSYGYKNVLKDHILRVHNSYEHLVESVPEEFVSVVIQEEEDFVTPEDNQQSDTKGIESNLTSFDCVKKEIKEESIDFEHSGNKLDEYIDMSDADIKKEVKEEITE